MGVEVVSRSWEVATRHGPARLLASLPPAPTLLLVLGHGASGGPDAPDLAALASRLPRHDVAVIRMEQPWRLAGRRVAPPPARLDEAWLDAVPQAMQAVAAWSGDSADRGGASADAIPGAAALPGVAAAPSAAVPGLIPLIVGGRSAGARVACRTARALEAVGCLALAFPLHPPGRPDRSRWPELADSGVPTLVVQGTRDPFGGPSEFPPGSHLLVAVADADHSFRPGSAVRGRRPAVDLKTPGQVRPLDVVAESVLQWLQGLRSDEPVPAERFRHMSEATPPQGRSGSP